MSFSQEKSARAEADWISRFFSHWQGGQRAPEAGHAIDVHARAAHELLPAELHRLLQGARAGGEGDLEAGRSVVEAPLRRVIPRPRLASNSRTSPVREPRIFLGVSFLFIDRLEFMD